MTSDPSAPSATSATNGCRLDDACHSRGVAHQPSAKEYEFHMYPGAGHGFFYYDRPAAYRAGPAVAGWEKVWQFLGRHLGQS